MLKRKVAAEPSRQNHQAINTSNTVLLPDAHTAASMTTCEDEIDVMYSLLHDKVHVDNYQVLYSIMLVTIYVSVLYISRQKLQ